MAKVLVVGGTGYVGMELVRQLSERNDEVTVLSRSKPELAAEWLKADITDPAGLKETLKGHSFAENLRIFGGDGRP